MLHNAVGRRRKLFYASHFSSLPFGMKMALANDSWWISFRKKMTIPDETGGEGWGEIILFKKPNEKWDGKFFLFLLRKYPENIQEKFLKLPRMSSSFDEFFPPEIHFIMAARRYSSFGFSWIFPQTQKTKKTSELHEKSFFSIVLAFHDILSEKSFFHSNVTLVIYSFNENNQKFLYHEEEKSLIFIQLVLSVFPHRQTLNELWGC